MNDPKRNPKDIKITECKILLRQTKWIEFVDMDDDGVKIDVELIERQCPVCGKEWLTLWLNDQVVYGGDCISFRDGRRIESCGCNFWKNETIGEQHERHSSRNPINHCWR